MTATIAPIEGTATQRALLEMWTENTGSHFLDSGGAYGRNWERNQGLTVADMMATPGVTLDASWGYVNITVSAFQWLDSFLEHDPRMQRKFELYSTLGDLKDSPWLECAERFAEAAHDRSWEHEDVKVVNTYNGESWLDSVLQYVVFNDSDGVTYALVQYHGGCDIRGGYTKPRAFRVLGEGRYEFYTEGHVSLYCTQHDGKDLGDGLFGRVFDSVHAWDSNSSGIEWVTYGGAFDTPEFEVIEHDDSSENYVACPTCKARMDINVMFGH
ncbi:Uncharacterised protein [Mycobacteroides abscessus subsp. abscessus]|uniref:hypothetical protein n=1 Tax=Mycobacteroides abscessus TaxID=36809 RepID=UPI000929551E|nr:hypothetical protein [Mycobacteroides abscessus]SHS98421.1 Uncharacterised protein [Mycobacteroides abscessus subsp. abscessus]SLK64804.1 Uncharacterised protein [Mycobacteroides abscessus subsp. abscessus]